MFALASLYSDYRNMFEGPRCDICQAMQCTGLCLYSCTEPSMSKLLKFRYYLKCRKQALDNFDESYMLVGDYVPDDWDEDITFSGDGPTYLNERVLAKYFTELTKLDEEDMLVGDYKYWNGFQKWGYSPLDGFHRKDLPLPVEFDGGPIIQSDDESTDEELEENDIAITTEPSESVANDEDESSAHAFDFIECLKAEFVIRPDEGIEIFIVEFELERMGKSYYLTKGDDEFWRSNEEWTKAKRRKMGKACQAFYRSP